jgi:hypothetical protein
MNRIARLGVTLAVLLLSGAAAAQTVKCTDRSGKVTYTNGKCSDLGLKDAGEVPDRININPAYQPTESLENRRPSPPSAPPEPPRAAAPASAPAAPAPGDGDQSDKRRCFTVATPKGNVTRCNTGEKTDE